MSSDGAPVERDGFVDIATRRAELGRGAAVVVRVQQLGGETLACMAVVPRDAQRMLEEADAVSPVAELVIGAPRESRDHEGGCACLECERRDFGREPGDRDE